MLVLYRTRRTTFRTYLRSCNGAHPIQHFYEKVIEVKADVAALHILVVGGFRHISTENVALGSLRSDDWQLDHSIDPQYPPFCLSCRETLLIFFGAA
jgi:hypothetical protein